MSPATSPVNLVQSLANTHSGHPDTDPLATRGDAIAWLRTAELLPGDAALSSSEHAALLRLREAVRDVTAARAAGRQDPDASARLTRALADGRLVVTVTPAGAVKLASSARAAYSSVVAAFAVAIAETAADGTWPAA